MAYDILRIMSDIEFLEHITLFLKAMYDEQKAAVGTIYCVDVIIVLQFMCIINAHVNVNCFTCKPCMLI